jgi:hypothetical protein
VGGKQMGSEVIWIGYLLYLFANKRWATNYDRESKKK